MASKREKNHEKNKGKKWFKLKTRKGGLNHTKKEKREKEKKEEKKRRAKLKT